MQLPANMPFEVMRHELERKQASIVYQLNNIYKSTTSATNNHCLSESEELTLILHPPIISMLSMPDISLEDAVGAIAVMVAAISDMTMVAELIIISVWALNAEVEACADISMSNSET